MICKFLIIRESGILPFYLSQDEINIDPDLISGFCRAIHGFSKEMDASLKLIDMDKYNVFFNEFEHKSGENFLTASICDKYHIGVKVKEKVGYIFKKYFYENNGLISDSKNTNKLLENNVKNELNDEHLRKYVHNNLDSIENILDPFIKNPDNCINGWLLTSYCNNILYYKCRDFVCVKKYLTNWGLNDIPQRLPIHSGIDLEIGESSIYGTSELKGGEMLGVVINTWIRHPREVRNEKEDELVEDNKILLYFFGRNYLLGGCVSNADEMLRIESENWKE